MDVAGTKLDLATYCGHGKVAGTKRALKKVGASVLSPTNEWEVLRFKTKHGVGVVYRNKKDKFTANPAAVAALEYVASGLSASIAAPVRKPKPRPSHAAAPRHSATIFADASLCPKTGAAGWGAWMVSHDLGSATAGGPLRDRYANSDEAEAAALANALAAAKRRGYLPQRGVVMLQSDSRSVLIHLRRRLPSTVDSPIAGGSDFTQGSPVGVARRAPKVAVARALEAIAALAESLELQFVVRHVKAHQSGDVSTGQGRLWVNNECDRLAKAGMAAARAALPSSIPQQAAQEAVNA